MGEGVGRSTSSPQVQNAIVIGGVILVVFSPAPTAERAGQRAGLALLPLPLLLSVGLPAIHFIYQTFHPVVRKVLITNGLQQGIV